MPARQHSADATPRPRRSRPCQPSPTTQVLFEDYAKRPTRQLRNDLVEAHLDLAHQAAARYGMGKTSLDDLRQIAVIGLIRAVERFDPHRGVQFRTFANRTMEGELKRHFRDESWSLKVPRTVKDLATALTAAADNLTNELGREPTAEEVADRLAATSAQVREARHAWTGYDADAIDATVPGLDPDHLHALAVSDDAIEGVDVRSVAGALLDTLSARERQIVKYRFWNDLTQSEIGQRLGISQMHVSRLLRSSLATLRTRAA